MCNCANLVIDSYNCNSNSLIGIGIAILDFFSGRIGMGMGIEEFKKHQFRIEFNSHYFTLKFRKFCWFFLKNR